MKTNKLFLGIGSMVAVAAPVATVVACGSSDDHSNLDNAKKMQINSIKSNASLTDAQKTTWTNKVNAAKTMDEFTKVTTDYTTQVNGGTAGTGTTTGGAHTAKTRSVANGEEFIALFTDKTVVNGFLDAIAKNNHDASDPATDYQVKDGLTITDFTNALNNSGMNTEQKEAITNLLKLNDNNPSVTAYVIKFTSVTAAPTMVGVAQAGLAVQDPANIKWLKDQMIHGSLKYTDIAQGNIDKFSDTSGRWKPMVTGAYNIDKTNKTMTETAGAALAYPFMGGQTTIESIINAAGYTYTRHTS